LKVNHRPGGTTATKTFNRDGQDKQDKKNSFIQQALEYRVNACLTTKNTKKHEKRQIQSHHEEHE
jgi:hypothetical protein